MDGRPRTTSWWAFRALQWGALALLILVAGSLPPDRATSDAARAAFVEETTHRWCQDYGAREDLSAIVIDVHFRPEPPLFSEGEGVVVAPLALELPGAQRVLDVATRPKPLRTLPVQGITAVAWEYGGRVHREMHFAGLALVERPPLERVVPPAQPSFAKLPAELRPEALARAADLEEHSLHECAAFPEWARETAGAGPYTAQIERLARAVAKPFEKRKRESEDLCAQIRERRLTPHRGQVAVVMAARELGIPAFGFASASDRAIHLVGTYSDPLGWILLDVEHPDQGWFRGGPPLVTMAPLLGGFTASSHDFWYPQAAAYGNAGWGTNTVSRTGWRGTLESGHAPTNTTGARTLRLSEVCSS